MDHGVRPGELAGELRGDVFDLDDRRLLGMVVQPFDQGGADGLPSSGHRDGAPAAPSANPGTALNHAFIFAPTVGA
jgi:hypothetical protein